MKKYIGITLLFVLVTFWAQAQIDAKDIGDFKSLKQTDSGVLIQTQNASLKVSAYGQNIIRVQVTPEKMVMNDTSYAVIQSKLMAFSSVRELAKSVIIATDSLTISISKFPLRINFYRKGGEFINGDHVQYGISWINGKVYNYRLLGKTEKIIGLGGKVGNLDRKSEVFKHWNTDVPAFKLTDDPLSQSVPFYMGAYNHHVYGLFLDNASQSTFDFGASNDGKFMSIDANNGYLNYYFFGANDVKQIISDYTWLTGRTTLPPLWSLGYQQSLPYPANESQILNWLQQWRNSAAPTDVFWLRNNADYSHPEFDWNKNLIPHPMQLIDSLKSMQIHVIGDLSPGILAQKSNPFFQEAIQKKYVATYPLGDIFLTQSVQGKPLVMPDFLRKEVRNWWGSQLLNFTRMGVDGFINDLNEPSVGGQHIPDRIQFGDRAYINVKNVYGMQMAKASVSGWQQILPQKRSFMLSKAGFSGLQRFAGVWMGNVSATDEHMMLTQRMIQNFGLSGMPLIGTNVGGNHGFANPELLLRWNALAVFAPLYMHFPSEQNPFQMEMQTGSPFDQILQKDMNLRYRLMPYMYSEWQQITENGLPLVKSLAIDYTWDEKIYDTRFQQEFLFGNQVLVCPVSSTVSETQVYLPQGNWYRLSTDSLFQGKKEYQVTAPLNDLPVFVKAGAIIPMQNKVKNTAESVDKILQLHIWKGDDKTEISYYEDDGITNDYLKGEFFKRKIAFDFKNMKLILSKVDGSFESRYSQIEVILHDFVAKTSVPTALNPTLKINDTGMASFTTHQMLPNSKEAQELSIDMN